MCGCDQGRICSALEPKGRLRAFMGEEAPRGHETNDQGERDHGLFLLVV